VRVQRKGAPQHRQEVELHERVPHDRRRRLGGHARGIRYFKTVRGSEQAEMGDAASQDRGVGERDTSDTHASIARGFSEEQGGRSAFGELPEVQREVPSPDRIVSVGGVERVHAVLAGRALREPLDEGVDRILNHRRLKRIGDPRSAGATADLACRVYQADGRYAGTPSLSDLRGAHRATRIAATALEATGDAQSLVDERSDDRDQTFSSAADPEDVARRVEFDEDRGGDGVGEVLGVRE
jgi:hypothetical protein